MLKEKLGNLRVSKPVSYYWILMWSLSYIACSIIKPNMTIGTNATIAVLVCPCLGTIMFMGLLFNSKPLLLGCGVFEVFAGVASWIGLIQWGVEWTTGYDPFSQISMALLDLISAVFLFHYSLEIKTKTKYI